MGFVPAFHLERNVGLVPSLAELTCGQNSTPHKRTSQSRLWVFGRHRLQPSRFPRELSAVSDSGSGWRGYGPGLCSLDEPAGALDPVTRLELQQQFLTLRERATHHHLRYA